MTNASSHALFLVHIRTNEGLDTVEKAQGIDAARTMIRRAKLPTNIMIRLDSGGRRVLRWDRNPASIDNRWRSVGVDAPEPATAAMQVVDE